MTHIANPYFNPQALPLYIHGLEGDPRKPTGKGGYMLQTFGRSGPKMPAKFEGTLGRPSCFEACFDIMSDHLRINPTSVLVGSSFGRGITMALLQRGLWRGPIVLLAPAIKRYQFDLKFPDGVHAIIIHDPSDDIISYADSIELQAANPKTCELWESDGGHRLSTIRQNGTLERAVKRQLQRAKTLI